MQHKTVLTEDDFPIRTEGRKIKSRKNIDLAVAVSEGVAAAITSCLNEDYWRRQDETWSA